MPRKYTTRKIADLQAALSAHAIVRDEATSALRALVDKIVAFPAQTRRRFDLELHGQRAVALNMAKYDKGGGGSGIPTLSSFRPIRIEV